jgi:hypothetical protein
MLEDQLDEAAFSGAEVPVHPPARQAMKERNWLLDKQSFEFVGGHIATDSKLTRGQADRLARLPNDRLVSLLA